MNKLNKNTKYAIALSISLTFITLISNVYATNNKTLSSDQELLSINTTAQSYLPGKFNLTEFIPESEVIQEINETDIKARQTAKNNLINQILSNETGVEQDTGDQVEQDTGDQLDAAINPYSNETATMQNGTLLVRGHPVDITYEQKGPFQIIDEDTLIEMVVQNGRATIDTFRHSSPWSSGVLPVYIQSDLPNKQRILEALRDVEDTTPLYFPNVNIENGKITDRFYLRFLTDPDPTTCYTYAGMLPRDAPLFKGYRDNTGMYHPPFYQSGKYEGQPVVLGSQCKVGNIIHEIGHTAGLHHEQKRCDRDNFITIIWANIPNDKKPQYQSTCVGGTSQSIEGHGNYDYCSIMHYPRGDPEKIRPLQQIVECNDIGQRIGYSQTDQSAIKSIYPFND